MNFPKKDFSIGIYSHKGVKDPFHADILALVREKGKLELEELECLYTPVNEICDAKELAQCSGEMQILRHLESRRPAVPPFRVYLQSMDAELFFQSEDHFEEGRNERRLCFHPGEAGAMPVLKQLRGCAGEIFGDGMAFRQLAALEELSGKFNGQYEIRMAASRAFLQHISYEVDALNLWNCIREILHGGKIPKEWPCRKESHVELQLENVSGGFFYSIVFETQKIQKTGNRSGRRKWSISERIAHKDSWEKPVFQSEAQAVLLNGAEVISRRTKSRLMECRHPFAKQILALPSL